MCGEAEAEGLGVGSNRMYECTFRCMKCKNAARCLSVCLSVRWGWCAASRRLKISSNFFLGTVARHFSFFQPLTDTQFQGEPRQRGVKHRGVGKNWRFSTEIAVYLGNSAR